jgi:prepilin-type processing-associated H-X9-DG protein
MKSKSAFTKIDLVVVLVCIVFLLANIAAISEGGRKRAQEAVCLSNLYKWGQIFQAYTADNDGYFHSKEIGTMAGYRQTWPYTYKPYYDDKMMRFCPTAVNPMIDTGPFGTWKYFLGTFYPLPDFPMAGEREYEIRTSSVRDGFYTGSYGMNRYVENLKGGSMGTNPDFWRRAGAKGGDKVPVLMDCMYYGYWASSGATPAAYNGDYTTPEMHWICIDRHMGYSNVVFLDLSARRVGLKELWTLKHSRSYDTCGPWTICGNGGSQQACAAAWDAAAPWMRNFPEY